MATVTEEVRTVFSWDTSGVNTGARNIERAAGNVLESERKIKRNLGGLAQDLASVRSGSDLAAVGINRLADVFKVGAGASIGIAAAFAAYTVVTEKGKEAVKDFSDAQLAADKALKGITRTTAAEGMSALASKGEQAVEVVERLNKLVQELSAGASEDATAAAKRLGVWTQGATAADMIAEAELKSRAINAELNNLRAKASTTLDRQLSAVNKLNSGEDFNARRAEVRAAKERELMQLKTSPITSDDTNLQSAEERYNVMAKIIDREEDLYNLQQDSARATHQIELSNVSASAKKIQLAKEAFRVAQEELSIRLQSGQMHGKELDAAKQKADFAQDNLRQVQREELFGKSPGAIRRKLRADAKHESKLRDFDKRMKETAGMIDIKRDLNGNIIGGRDAITGEKYTGKAIPSALRGLRTKESADSSQGFVAARSGAGVQGASNATTDTKWAELFANTKQSRDYLKEIAEKEATQ